VLKRLTVDNYRSLERVQVALHPFTAFVGANGTGKSSLLRAIDLVLGQRYPNVSSSAFQQNTWRGAV
jgi:AAA15 family ATPase/GTPase